MTQQLFQLMNISDHNEERASNVTVDDTNDTVEGM